MLSDKTYSWLFNGVQTIVALEDGQQVVPINFDNAATTPPFKQVDDFILENIMMYGSVGRGGHKSSYCTHAYEISREEVLKFFGVAPSDGYDVIYVKNTTEGINLLANILCEQREEKVLTSRLEHHANDLPWRRRAHVYYTEPDKMGRNDLGRLEEMLARADGTISYVTLSAASNVTGYITPIHEAARIAHRYGAKLIIDGAQIVAHRKVNLLGSCEEEAIDAFVFSGHKMYAPFGEGVVIVKKELVEKKAPYLVGGGMVSFVFDDDVYYKPSPYKDEAGTPNFLGAMAIIAAMKSLESVGYKAIIQHEEALSRKMMAGLKQLPEVIIYGEQAIRDRVGVISFNVKGQHCSDIGRKFQAKRGIAVRTGCFCAQPYVMRLLGISNEAHYHYMSHPDMQQPGMIRISFGLYNTEEEVEIFLETLKEIIND